MAGACAECRQRPPVGECGLCDPCLTATTTAEREAQGLAPTVDDPAVLDRIATVLGADRRRQANAA